MFYHLDFCFCGFYHGIHQHVQLHTIWDIFWFTCSKHLKQAKIQDERFHETILRRWDRIPLVGIWDGKRSQVIERIKWTSSYDWMYVLLNFFEGDLFFVRSRGICRDCWSDKTRLSNKWRGFFFGRGWPIRVYTHSLLGKSLEWSLIPLVAWKFVCSCKDVHGT